MEITMVERDIILFSAMSIDGFIAKKDGNLDWLFEFDKNNENKDEADTIFKTFYKTIDTTVIGRKTYDQICNEGHINPYPEKDNYVISKSIDKKSEYVKYITEDLEGFITEQKRKEGKPIWLVGGGKLNSYFLMNNHISSIILDIIPVILGNGIKLFEDYKLDINTKMKLDNIVEYKSGRIHISYSKI
jgi:dihydrofolate reductase